MANIEYMSRDQVASESLDPEAFLPMNLGVIVKAIGDRALFDDLVLSPGATAHKEHGPRSAIYSATDLSNGVLLSTARFHSRDHDEEGVLADRILLADSVLEAAEHYQIFDRKVFDLIHTISVIGTFPGRQKPLPSGAAEVRQTPGGGQYVAVAVPTYLRTAPQFISRYIQGMKREGRPYDPALEEVAYQNDTRKVARMLAVNTMYHIQKGYEEHDDLEAQFADE